MTKRTRCILGANTLTTFAGMHNVVHESGLTATGVGLFNIASSSTVNALASEGIISAGLKKKLATLILVANFIPLALGIATIADSERATSAGLGQMALGVASSVQCLDAIGAFKEKSKGD